MKCRPGCLPLNLKRFGLPANTLFEKDEITSIASRKTEKIQAKGLYMEEERRLMKKKYDLVGPRAKFEYEF